MGYKSSGAQTLGKWFQSGGMKSAPPFFNDGFPGLNATEMVMAVELLQNANTALPFSRQEALLVAQQLQSRRYSFDEVFMRAGDKSDSDFMLWILQGQAIVEAVSNNPKNPGW